MKKVMVGMSGGVDSSVAAKLLTDGGYDVAGVTLELFSAGNINDVKAGKSCCAISDVEDARSVACRLGIEHSVFNFKNEFRNSVMRHFVQYYLSGQTPNPCVECNRRIKFGKMLEYAEDLGFEFIATGHYAVITRDENTGRYLLKRPVDRSKDQTYVLYSLTQHQLARTLFPLGGLTKTQVRNIAENAGLINAGKKDSQDICFVPDGDYARFIRNFSDAEIPEGEFRDTHGNVIGQHKGIIFYTVGQRKGLGISLGKPAYVVSKDAGSNVVVLGDESDLFTTELNAVDVNLISVPELTSPMRITAKTRYSQSVESEAVLSKIDRGKYHVTFDKPQRAVTSGQAVVFYDGDIVVGGGTIV